ncbi:MAG: ATP-dependent sacrificial sulfur transferase LarE [Deltaproteobacteria bacterium]|nr:ATP-dependent sacrificial sulfur transferase LarE [Deltaproteobacteria bacterium]
MNDELRAADEATERKLADLRERLKAMGSVLVCYSGGLDSGFVLAVAHGVLGDKAVAMTATGPALAPKERDDACALARSLGARIELVDAGEIEDAGYVANGPDRCFHCKKSLYVTAKRVAGELGLGAILNGTNLDDLGDYRPGLDAARQHGVLSPLLDCGFSKQDIRNAARLMGLSLWDKPAAACLASRIPYGTAVTRERLTQVAGFEQALKDLGLRHVRVRHHDTVARIEVGTQDIVRVATSPLRESVVEAGKQNGYAYITVDLAGYRTGSHNEVLDGRHLKTIA